MDCAVDWFWKKPLIRDALERRAKAALAGVLVVMTAPVTSLVIGF